jgi:hypothetical protein
MPYIFYVESINQPDIVFRKISLCDNALVTKFVETICDSFGLKIKNILEYELKNDNMHITSAQLESMPLFKKKKINFDHIFETQNECRLSIWHTLGSVQMQVVLVEHQDEENNLPMIIQSKGRLTMLARR